MNKEFKISAIVAAARNRVIGDGDNLLWKIPEDFKRLKEITMGCPLIMGRKTWDSIGKPLPGRANIVLTRNSNWHHEDALKAETIEQALDIAKGWLLKIGSTKNEIFIFGGMDVYNIGLKFCNYIYLTEVNLDPISIYKFPRISEEKWKLIYKSEQKKTIDHIKFKFLTYERISLE